MNLRPTQACHFEWLSDLAKYSVVRSIAQSPLQQLSFYIHVYVLLYLVPTSACSHQSCLTVQRTRMEPVNTGLCVLFSRPTQPFILTGSINRVPTCPIGVKVTSVGWQITLCDPIDKWRPVVLRWISRRTIRSFTFYLFILISQIV